MHPPADKQGSIVEYWTENGRDHIVRLCEKRSLHADRLSMSKSGILEPPEWLHIVCDVIAAVQWAAQFLKRFGFSSLKPRWIPKFCSCLDPRT